MDTEAKAKVVASVWGAEFVQILAALAVLPRSISVFRIRIWIQIVSGFRVPLDPDLDPWA